jgi:hypothetical protein
MSGHPPYSPYQALAEAIAAAGSETCPACQKPVFVDDPQVQVNGCNVHARVCTPRYLRHRAAAGPGGTSSLSTGIDAGPAEPQTGRAVPTS